MRTLDDPDDIDLRIAALTRELDREGEHGDVDLLVHVAGTLGHTLPADYLRFVRTTDGAEGDVGERLLRLWPVLEIVGTSIDPPRYDDVLLFAGDGANTIFGFDARDGGMIVEGDWIGLNRDELIPHGRTFLEFLESLAGQ